MYNELVQELKINKFINDNNKVSPWIERKISEELRQKVIDVTNFLTVEVTISDRVKIMLLGITEQPLCLHCGSPTNYFREYTNFAKYCSPTCFDKSEERSTISKEIYKQPNSGIGHNSARIQREKYGGKLAIQVNPEVRNKAKRTCMERYGVDNGSKTPEAREKISKAMTGKKMKYKGIKPFHSHFNEEQLELINDVDKLYDMFIEAKKPVTTYSVELGFNYSYLFQLFNRLGYDIPIFKGKGISISKAETHICQWLDDNKISYIPQYKIGKKKIDIVIPDYNLAIEYNGIDHSYGKHTYSRLNNWLEEDRNIHKNREKLLQENGFRLIQIFENEWLNKTKQTIWKSILASNLGLNNKIYGRHCNINLVDTKECTKFLEDNHIQGNCRSSVKLGLYYKEELVSVMTFGIPRISKKYQWELIRFSNKLNTTVIGGASKLFNHFIENYEPKHIVSYCDKRIFNGQLYETLGFTLSHISLPNYFYFNNSSKLEPRQKYQKHKLNAILPIFDPKLSERENMYNNGYRRIWDCGNKVYVWSK